MIIYKQDYNRDGKIVTRSVIGRTTEGCAEALAAFRLRHHITRSSYNEALADVKNGGKPHSIARDHSAARTPKKKKLTLSEMLNGAIALVDIIKGDIATDREIQRRAAICAECPMISDTSDSCTGCKQNKMSKFARDLAVKYGRNFIQPMIIAQHTTPKRTGRISEFYCGFCGCSCLNLILSHSKHFLKKENSARPANCWVHDEVTN